MKKRVYFYIISFILKNNKQELLNNGYRVRILKNKIEITYKENTYTITVNKRDNEYIIKLDPYNKSYFATKIKIGEIKSKIKMTMFAIHENEKLYQ